MRLLAPALVVGVAVGATALVRAAPAPAGLTTNNAETEATVTAVRGVVGATLCYGLIALENPTGAPATLRSVKPVSGTGLQIGPVSVVPPGRPQLLTGLMDECPESGRPLAGSVIPAGSTGQGNPDAGTELLVPVRLVAEEGQVAGFAIEYEQEGERRTVVNTTRVRVCTSRCTASRPG